MSAITADNLHPDNLLTPHQEADWLGVTEGYLRVRRVKGGGPPFVKVGGAVRYRVRDTLTYLEQRTATSTSQALVTA